MLDDRYTHDTSQYYEHCRDDRPPWSRVEPTHPHRSHGVQKEEKSRSDRLYAPDRPRLWCFRIRIHSNTPHDSTSIVRGGYNGYSVLAVLAMETR